MKLTLLSELELEEMLERATQKGADLALEKYIEMSKGNEFVPAEVIAEENNFKSHVHLLRKIRASGVETTKQGRSVCIRRKDTTRVLQTAA